MNTELTIKGDIEVLRLQPGDAIVVNLEMLLTGAQMRELKREVEEQFPDRKVVVVAPGIRLSVQREELA